jgi:hypothetical protein
MTGKTIAAVSVVSAVAVAFALAVILTRGGNEPVDDIAADRPNVFGHPAQASNQPVPTGRPAAGAEDFRRDPCAVATVEELGVALAQPFHNVSGTYPRRVGPPAVKPAGCIYSYLGDGSDPAETYHRLQVTVTQAPADGAKMLSECLTGTPKIPYGPVEAGDQACLAAGSNVVVRVGAHHYTVNVAATPTRADRKDEETELAPLVKTAAKLLASRLPGR